MSTLEELTSWRVAAIEGKLPDSARNDRWQPVRAGLVNLWEYDAAEVWYADGRMQLQGANESGKSTLLTLTTLLARGRHLRAQHRHARPGRQALPLLRGTDGPPA
jgi:hypothetical protein